MIDTRDSFIDFLRFIGLSLIIFAHVDPPAALFQLRNFDVPLMVLVSAMAFGLSFRPGTPYGQYVWSRMKRLAFPAWIFLTGYFAVLLWIEPNHPSLAPRTVLESYALIGGIGYVWIIRIFLFIALAAPFIYRFHQSTGSNIRYLAVLLAVYLTYELCRYVTLPYLKEGVWHWVSLVVYFLIPYSVLFALGLRLSSLGRGGHWALLFGALVTFVVLGAYLYMQTGDVVATQQYKYPPSAYYFSYALVACMVLCIMGGYLWQVVEKVRPLRATVLFIARNSLWVYLWHIPFAEHVEAHFVLKYVVVYMLAVIITVWQSYAVKGLLTELQAVRVRNNVKAILTG